MGLQYMGMDARQRKSAFMEAIAALEKASGIDKTLG